MDALSDPGKKFGDFLSYLTDRNILSFEAANRARNAYSSVDHPADTVLIELGLVREADLARYLSDFFEVEHNESLPDEINPALIDAAGFSFLEANAVLPISIDRDGVRLAVADAFNREPIDAISYLVEQDVKLAIFPRSTILERIRILGEAQSEEAQSEIDEIDGDFDSDDIDRLRDIAREAPIIRFVSRIIQMAVDQGATDLHIEPMLDHVRIRFRTDGMLSVVDTAPRSMHPGIATRIKILSRLNIAERRLPQDGRMRIAVRGQEIDLRVSVLPTVHGETFVLRVLDKSGVDLKLGALGYTDEAIETLRNLVQIPNGIVLVTGPTGSGKTTTLYSLLRERDASEVKIFTVEDPVEYRLDGITQLQVDPAIDLTFARALRSVLRQDPDIILVGEIRDRESAQIAIQASLTGHLVFSTLHTNSAAGALTRLRDMGVEDYLIGASIRAVVAQRLLRKICVECGGSDPAKGTTADPDCGSCRGSGYSGRTVTYEIMEMTNDLAGLVSSGAGERELSNQARKNGSIAMGDHAADLVATGVTTRDEVRRVLELGGI